MAPRVQENPTLPGTGVVVAVAKPGGAPITVVSAYGLIQLRANGVRYAVPSVHGLLNNLTATLDVHRSREPVVLAGDLNVSPQIPPPDRDAHAAVIARLEAFGLRDCFDTGNNGYVRTHRHRNDPASTPYQDDWVFASPSFRVVECAPRDEPAAWELSDHCPVVADLELGDDGPSISG